MRPRKLRVDVKSAVELILGDDNQQPAGEYAIVVAILKRGAVRKHANSIQPTVDDELLS